MKDCFKVIGYYICEINDTPGWFQGISRQILSVSGCIGEQHPRWECFMGGWLKGEAREYQEKLRLDGEQYREFSETANCLFDAQRLDVDCRFLKLSDAGDFYEKFCQAIPCCVVSISTTMEYYKILLDELKGSNSHALMNGENDNSTCLGNDILGWDIGGFHSFLCNSLQKELPDVTQLIQGFHFEAYTDTLLKDLSTGNRKKVFLITAFALQTKLLFLDEPVNGLDFQSTEYLYQQIVKYKEVGTVLFSSHILESISLTSDRVLVLENGKIRQALEHEQIKSAEIREVLHYENAV